METDKEYAIRLAMEYGFTGGFDALGNLTFDVTVVEAILEAIQHEREACIAIAESKHHAPNFALTSMPPQNGTAVDISNAIRARGNKE